MDAAVATLAARGLTELRLWVLRDNVRARRFYERYGWRPDGVRSTYRLGRGDHRPVDLAELRYVLRLPGDPCPDRHDQQ